MRRFVIGFYYYNNNVIEKVLHFLTDSIGFFTLLLIYLPNLLGQETAKELFKVVLNSNFRSFIFELKKKRFFKINFDLGFRIL